MNSNFAFLSDNNILGIIKVYKTSEMNILETKLFNVTPDLLLIYLPR